MDNDVEVVQRKRYQPCTKHFDGWRLPDGTQLFQWGCCYRSFDSLPDPLADTPEGWYEFGQILKWIEDKRHTKPYLPWAFEIKYYGENSYSAAFWLVGNRYTAVATAEASGSDPRGAVIAALAAAVRPESEDNHDAG